jgi:head-tail adaptor
MKPGKLAYIVTVQRWVSTGVNDFGTDSGAWQHLATLRAELVQLSTEEAMTARGAGDEAATVWRVRDKVQITPADRVVFRSKWHSIREVIATPGALDLHCVSWKGPMP